MRVGGVILCGGKSSRMGCSKAMLPFGDEVMLQRVARVLGAVVQPLVVVAAADQPLPDLDAAVSIARDEQRNRGPLEGIRAGLCALGDQADAAYITSCDVPLLEPEFVRQLVHMLDDYAAVVPVDGKFHHPLSAVYRTSVLPEVDRLRAAQRLRPVFLYDCVATLRVPVDELRRADPELRSLVNLNHPEDYLAALQSAGLSPQPDVLKRLGIAPK